jgi:hypothetical protein
MSLKAISDEVHVKTWTYADLQGGGVLHVMLRPAPDCNGR